MKSAILAIRIIGDATGAVAAMNKAQRATMTFREKLGRASSAASVALGAIGVGAKQCVDAAADLQQSIGGLETVFGASSSQMLQWSRDAAQAVGLSQNEYNTFATIVGSQLQNLGMSVDASAGKTNELISLGADLSSMFGGTTADAVEALSAALKGEMDPIEKYGISLNDATLKVQAASMGLGDLYAAGDRGAKMQATLAAITAQSGRAMGNFAREADTAQGQQQRANAAWQNAQATLGQALLPAITAAAQKMAEFATWVQQNSAWLTPLAIAIGVIAGAIVLMNGAWTAYTTISAIVQAATLGTAGAFGVLAGVTGIGLLIAAIGLLVANWDTVKEKGAQAAQWIGDRWNELWGWITGIWNGIGSWFHERWQQVSDAASGAAQWINERMTDLYNMLPPGAQQAVNLVGSSFSWLGAAVSGDHDAMARAARSLYDSLPGWAQTGVQAAGHAFDFLKSAATGNFDGMRQAATALFDMLPGWAQNAIRGVIGFFQDMYDRVTGFFDGIRNMINRAFGWVGDLIGRITGASNSAASLPQQQSSPAPMSVQPMSRAASIMQAATLAAMPRIQLPGTLAAVRAGEAIARPRTVRPVTVNLTVNASSSIMTPGTAPEVGKDVYRAVRAYFDTYGSKPL